MAIGLFPPAFLPWLLKSRCFLLASVMNGNKSGNQRDIKRGEKANRSVSLCSARSGVNPFRFLSLAFLGGGGGGGVCISFSFVL